MQIINFLINLDVIIYVYGGLLFFLIAGIIIKDKPKNIKDYALGIKPFPKHFLVATMAATLIGGGSTIGEVSLYYNKGLLYMFPAVLGYFGYIIFARYILPRLDKYYGELSVASLLSRMYGKSVERFSGIIAYIYCFSVLAMQVKAIGIIIEYALGYNSIFATILSFLVITIYSAWGGVRSVIRTDVIQFLIFIVVLPTIAVFLLKENGGVYAVLKETSWRINENFNLASYISLFVFVFIPDISPIFIHRILVGRERNKNKEIIYLTVLMQLICSFFVIIVSAIAIGRYQGMSGNLVFFKTIDEVVQNNFFHAVFAVAILAVILSSADSLMNTGAIILVENVIKNKMKNNNIKLVVVKIVTALGGLLGLSIALNAKNLIEAIWFIAQYYAVMIVVPFIGGLFIKNTSSYIFWGSSIAGFISYTLLKILAPEIEYTAYIISIAVSLMTFMCIKYFVDKNVIDYKQFLIKLENGAENIIKQMNIPVSKLGYAIMPISFFTLFAQILLNYINVNIIAFQLSIGIIAITYIFIDIIFRFQTSILKNCYILFTIWYCFPFLSTYIYYLIPNSSVALSNMVISGVLLAVIFTSRVLLINIILGGVIGSIVFVIFNDISLGQFIINAVILSALILCVGIICASIVKIKENEIKKFTSELIKKTSREGNEESLKIVNQYAYVIDIVKKHEQAKSWYLEKRSGFKGNLESDEIIVMDMNKLITTLKEYLLLIELEKEIKFNIQNRIKNITITKPMSIIYTIIFSIAYQMTRFKEKIIYMSITNRNDQMIIKYSLPNMELNINEVRKYIRAKNNPEGIMNFDLIEKIIKEQSDINIKFSKNSIVINILSLSKSIIDNDEKFIDIYSSQNKNSKVLN